ncbi:MAG: hypothetical protein QXO30_01890 [Candidatus Caldarchaeum sp.]
MLPLQWLLKRLSNEEQKLREKFPEIKLERQDLFNEATGAGRIVKIPVPVGIDEVEAVRVYRVNGLKASGYVKERDTVKPLNTHSFEIYILRSYPFGLYSLKNPKKLAFYDAPIRIRHLSNVYHPNIMPGPAYLADEYAGAVCWAVYANWLQTMTLEKIVEGYRDLIENPNPDPKEALNRPICKEAATYFMSRLTEKHVAAAQQPVRPTEKPFVQHGGQRKPVVVGVS